MHPFISNCVIWVAWWLSMSRCWVRPASSLLVQGSKHCPRAPHQGLQHNLMLHCSSQRLSYLANQNMRSTMLIYNHLLYNCLHRCSLLVWILNLSFCYSRSAWLLPSLQSRDVFFLILVTWVLGCIVWPTVQAVTWWAETYSDECH